MDVRRLGPIDDLAGREGARRKDLAGPLQFGGGEDLGGAGRRIVDRRRAHGQVDHRRPVLLRDKLVLALLAVGVGVDQTRDDGLAGDVDRLGVAGDRDAGARADRDDTVAADDDDAVVYDTPVLGRHGDDPRAGQGHDTGRLVGRDLHGQRQTALRRLELARVLGRAVGGGRSGVKRLGLGREQVGTQAPVNLLAVIRPVYEVGAIGADPCHRQRPALLVDRDLLRPWHQRHDEGLVVLTERDVPAIGRDLVVVDHVAAGVDALGLTAEVGADQLALVPLGHQHEHAIIGGAELRLGSVARDPHRRSARRRDPIDAGIL